MSTPKSTLMHVLLLVCCLAPVQIDWAWPGTCSTRTK